MSAANHASVVGSGDRPMPPVAWLSSAALVLVIVGGITLASYAPRPAPLGLASALLGVAIALMVAAAGLLVRIKAFAWSTFGAVFKWALLAYVIVAGMIEFAFVHDHTRGPSLVVVTLMLAVFAFSVPTTIAFTTARYVDSN
ncbi:MAG: hypothetical protein ACYDB2_10875 [Acidimicrobiales bacterium]